MIENLNELYYSKIANNLNEIIPVKWKKVALCAEVDIGVVTIYFYFYDESKSTFEQGGFLHKQYGVNRRKYKAFSFELSDLILDLHKDIKEKTGDNWTILSFILYCNGEFKTNFGYENLYESCPIDRRKIWKNKYLTLD